MSWQFRVLCANFRLEPIPADIDAGRGWPARRALTADLIRKVNPMVILGQECSEQIRTDLLKDLGGSAKWGYYRNGHVIVWVQRRYVVRDPAVPYKEVNLPSPEGADPRRLVVVRLRLRAPDNSAALGPRFDVASSHFSRGEPYWQNQQMQAVVRELQVNWNARNAVFGADINNSMMFGDCPRETARAAYLGDVWDKLGPMAIANDLANTYNGFHDTVYASERIDGVWMGSNVDPTSATVIETGGASDHNWLRVSMRLINES